MDELFEGFCNKFSQRYRINVQDKRQEFNDVADFVNAQFSRKEPMPSYDDYEREVLKQSWEHFEKKYNRHVDNSKALDFVESYDQFRNDQSNALKGLYQNTRFNYERQEMKTLVLDIDINTGTTFSETLTEPFTIDKLCNVYLDGFTTFQCNACDSEIEMAFLLTIDQLNVQSVSSTAAFNNTIIIPNEQTTTPDPALSKVHKGKKFNYLCQINPQKLRQITGKITAIDGTTTMFTTAGRVIIELLFVAAEKLPFK